jgi:hypothetical protein
MKPIHHVEAHQKMRHFTVVNTATNNLPTHLIVRLLLIVDTHSCSLQEGAGKRTIAATTTHRLQLRDYHYNHRDSNPKQRPAKQSHGNALSVAKASLQNPGAATKRLSTDQNILGYALHLA